jgi:hypothetical protein
MLSATSLDISRLHPFVTVRCQFYQSTQTLITPPRFVGILLLLSKCNCANTSLRLEMAKENRQFGEKSMCCGLCFFLGCCLWTLTLARLDLPYWNMDTGHLSEVSAFQMISVDLSIHQPHTARQEMLLQGLMREIVRMTAHQQPLEVGVPLFPFSHAGVFGKEEASHKPSGSVAPLPTFKDQPTSPPSVHSVVSSVPSEGTRPLSSSGWSMHDVSVTPPDV